MLLYVTLCYSVTSSLFHISHFLPQITLFLQAITSNSPKITFCGFVEVNRGLMASVRMQFCLRHFVELTDNRKYLYVIFKFKSTCS
jgi:hypothetical protein